jgi:uncharacterized protein
MMRKILALALIAFSSPALADSAVLFHDMIAGAIDGYARPGLAALATAAGDLHADVAGLCVAPSAAALQTAQQEFKDTVVAYSRVEFFRMGPLNVDERAQRLLYWPDKKGIALKQVQQALASTDATAADARTLSGKSVAMQGLFAVEALLFGTGSDGLSSRAGAYRCSFAAAATSLIADLTKTLSTEWAATGTGSAADAMLNPVATNPDYRTEFEVINKLAATLGFASDTIRDQRLSPVLSLSTGAPKPHSALFWRSGMTGAALAANFAGLRDFFVAAKFPEALTGPNDWIGKGIVSELDNAIDAAGKVPASMDEAVGDPAGLLGLKQMYVSTGSIDTLNESLGTALGLSTGFSTLDGD